MQRKFLALFSMLTLVSCPKPGGGSGNPPPVQRCEVDLKASGLFKYDGTGSTAQKVTASSQLIGGEGATGRLGDVLLQNDKLRVIIEQPGRTVGPFLSGGGIVDADVQRASGEAGRDVFGRMSLTYAFGRLTSVRQVEILSDGSDGGPAVVAATGVDSEHDLIALESLINSIAGLNIKFVVDAKQPLPVRGTTYYVLSPGEERVRMLTAYCNDGDKPVQLPLIELLDVGAFEIFNPGPCGATLGLSALDISNTECALAPSKWFGVQADGVAYGVRSMSLADPTKPVAANALLGYGGVLGTVIEGESLAGVISWTDDTARERPGSFTVRSKKQGLYLRDFVVSKDLLSVASALEAIDGEAQGSLNVAVTLPGGGAAAGARVNVKDSTGAMVGVMEADAAGHASAKLKPGAYTLSAALYGRVIGSDVQATVTAGASTDAALGVGDGHTLHVSVRDAAGAPMPAKLTVFCVGGPCAYTADTYRPYFLRDSTNMGAAAVEFVPVSGEVSVQLPPGQYEAVVSRGPEYSTWPDTWPTSGAAADLTAQDVTLNATLGRIVDTTGWMSADLHVHAYNSSDSAVRNTVRAANYLAEGVDVLLSTDHEVITDYAPIVASLGASQLMATMIGEEVTSFDHGHFNTFPLTLDASKPSGGAFDHAGGEDGPEYRVADLFPAIRAQWPGAVAQLNHPRGGMGSLSLLKADTDTLATHGDPKTFNMLPAPDATAEDTKLLGDTFDSVEVANGPTPSLAVMNDWMTFLSRGTVRASTGVSDSHHEYSDQGGYARTYARVGVDTAAEFSPDAFAEAVRQHHLFVSNGPLLGFTAQKLDAQGQPTGAVAQIGDTLSVTSGDTVRFTVDVQGLEWMQLDRVELYSHAPGREAFNGVSNPDWPEGRILQKHTLDPATAPLEAVPGSASLRRQHLVETFDVPVTADTWFVGMARATTGRTMRPLHDALPFAWSNAILIDADGSGAYDDFPLKPGQPLRVSRPTTKGPPTVPSPQDFVRAISSLINHSHE